MRTVTLFMGFLVSVSILLTSCDSKNTEILSPSNGMTFSFKKAPFNNNNPFDSVGFYHNEMIRYGLEGVDTNIDTTASLFWASMKTQMSMIDGVTESQLQEYADTVGQYPNRDWRDYLSKYSSTEFTAREIHYINRIGDFLLMDIDTTEGLDSLGQIEADIIAESWPAGDTTEVAARLCISVAKHSYYWWKQFFTSEFQKSNASSEEEEDKLSKVVAADVAGVLSWGASTYILGGPITLVGGAAATVGASITKGIKEYWEDIKSGIDSALDWACWWCDDDDDEE